MRKWIQVIVFSILAVVAGVVSWVLWNYAGFSETPPSLPQFVEVYVAGSPTAAAVSLAATLAPENKSGQACHIEDPNCNDAAETITIQVTPEVSPADWLLVVDKPPSSSSPASVSQNFVKTRVDLSATSKSTTVTVPAVGFTRSVWVYHEVDANSVKISMNYPDLPIVSRPANHLVIEMPDLFNEFDPTDACGPQVGFESQPPVQPRLLPVDLGNAFCPTMPTPLPALGPTMNYISYYAPAAATSTEVLKDPQQFTGFTLDSSDDAVPISDTSSSTAPDAYDWSGDYQLQPTVYASSIQGAGRVSMAQLALGVMLGALLAAIFSVIQVFFQK